MQAIRTSLATSITSLFWFAAVAMALGFVATLFLEEIPLGRTHQTRPAAEAAADELADVGLALAPHEARGLPPSRRPRERVA